MLFKNEGRLQMFHEQYPDIVKRKKEVIEKFDSKELEHLLSNSTKNVAQEVVGCLIPGKGKGILNEIENSFIWENHEEKQNSDKNTKYQNNEIKNFIWKFWF